MKDEDRYKLLFGPYEPPKIPRNKRLFCEMRGYLKFGGYSKGPIPWPRRYRTNSIILCGDLVLAVKQESVETVSYHWGVCRNVVQKWRKALEVPEHNPGTRQSLHRARADLEPQIRQRADVRAKNRAEILPRRPLVHERSHSLRRLATSRLVKERIARTGHLNPELRVWTPREDKLVGTGPDDEIARKLGRTRIAVGSRRRTLGIASWNHTYHRLWTDKEEALLGVVPDRKLARMLDRPFKGIQARRELKGLPPAQPLQRRFTPEEDALLGTKPDKDVARMLGREVTAVATRRQRLGIPIKNPLIHRWTPREDRLLGTKPDQEIARELHRSLLSVRGRRQHLGIPNAHPKHWPWTEEEVRMLGTRSDEEVAALLGRSHATVIQQRFKRGIHLQHPKHKFWTEEEEKLLGTRRDEEVAQLLHRSLSSVKSHRRSLDIPALWRKPADSQ